MALQFQPIDTGLARAYRAGGPDAYGRAPERGPVSDGAGVPCRHCLCSVPAGQRYLILAHRPFPEVQPYAETGPIFLCESDCESWCGDGPPPILTTSPDYLLKGYTADHRILYGTGRVVSREELIDYAEKLLSDPRVAFVDVRSARNNCYQLRIFRARAADLTEVKVQAVASR